jgi:hypothetical protein
MPRNRTNGAVLTPPTAEQAPPPSPPALRPIDPTAVGTLPAWSAHLGLPKHCLKREARLKRLVVYKRAGRLWTDGVAILAWLRGGEVKRRRAEEE